MFNKNKLSYITGAEINVPDTSIYEYLLMRSRRNGARIISRCHEAELSLERLKSESEIYARAFRKLGVKEGRTVLANHDMVRVADQDLLSAKVRQGTVPTPLRVIHGQSIGIGGIG